MDENIVCQNEEQYYGLENVGCGIGNMYCCLCYLFVDIGDGKYDVCNEVVDWVEVFEE